jgi:DNA-binding YbaB/EbfC family protein
MNNMLKQAQKMQAEMQKAQAEVEAMEFLVSSGGGAVEVTITGKKEIKAMKLDPEIVDPEDIDMMTDIIIAAVNEAIRKASDASEAAMNRVSGGLGGMF